MKHTEIVKDGLRFRFPNSGVVLGCIADALRLKHVIYGDTAATDCGSVC